MRFKKLDVDGVEALAPSPHGLSLGHRLAPGPRRAFCKAAFFLACSSFFLSLAFFSSRFIA